MTAPDLKNLVDVIPVQAARLADSPLHELMAADRVDPFGHGVDRAGQQRGSISVDGVPDAPGLTLELLRSLDGSLPDYLIEALQSSLSEGDTALYDFLGIFDRRLFGLVLEYARTGIRVAEYDATSQGSGLLRDGIARSIPDPKVGEQMLPAMLALLSRNRNLETLTRLLTWLSKRPVRVRAAHGYRQHLDRRDLSRLGRGTRLDGSAVLGNRGVSNRGRITVEIDATDASDLEALLLGQHPLGLMAPVTRFFLREPVEIVFLARITRRHLNRPCLSQGDRQHGLRLGRYGCLEPGTRPDDRVGIQIHRDLPAHYKENSEWFH